MTTNGTTTTTPTMMMTTPSREVASGVVNLGNTCYMNAVLQALAHAPELCMAMDCEPHQAKCPTALRNLDRKKMKQKKDKDSHHQLALESEPSDRGGGGVGDGNGTTIPSSELDNNNSTTTTTGKTKSKGKTKTKSKGKGKSPPGNIATLEDGGAEDESVEFCLLCEVERHLSRVHHMKDASLSSSMDSATTSASTEAVAPSTFVKGFISHVAPWFKLGVQEDSHEFLRLLIDAMQKSCYRARNELLTKSTDDDQSPNSIDDENHDNNNNTNGRLQDKPSINSDRKKRAKKSISANNDADDGENNEYVFKLFRGTVESIVTCSYCKAVSSTLDPVEDIGLDVMPIQSSGTTSPLPTALADVTSALERFITPEKLDSGYKCDRCGKLGRATKQSSLASIPPILTLHLKRFRYGSADSAGSLATTGTSRSRRGIESQPGSDGGSFFASGSSGSAKIEGHVKFEQIFDIRPYVTKELQSKIRSMFCRLFAVIVHAGKNSHSGHYIAYVRNVAKNEWWKMDDARVTRVSSSDVFLAEAYMLFYRVVDHPVAAQLRDADKAKKEASAAKAAAEAILKEEERSLEEVIDLTVLVQKNDSEILRATESSATCVDFKVEEEPITDAKRKREIPKYTSGEEWARSKTQLPDSFMSIFRRAEDYLSEQVDFKPEYFRLITDEAAAGGKVGAGPSGVSMDDVQGGVEVYRKALIELLYKIATTASPDGSDLDWFLLSDNANMKVEDDEMEEDLCSSLIIPVMDANETLL